MQTSLKQMFKQVRKALITGDKTLAREALDVENELNIMEGKLLQNLPSCVGL